MQMDSYYMQEAIKEADRGTNSQDGGPFGSVIVKNNAIVGRGHNRVLAKHDPTCHGEIEAIRDACQNLKTHDLSGCTLYTTAEPCPMCLGAILWANIETVHYGCTKEDSANIGFRDDAFYKVMDGRNSSVLDLIETDRSECLKLFERYSSEAHELY